MAAKRPESVGGPVFHSRCNQQLSDARDEVAYLRAQVRGLQERNDRLVEALARRYDAQLQLPVEPYTPATMPDSFVPATDTGLNAWWAAVGNSPRIASPVKEDKVPAPNS